jgi:hypothetical protein
MVCTEGILHEFSKTFPMEDAHLGVSVELSKRIYLDAVRR